jgi:hypothetical protein
MKVSTQNYLEEHGKRPNGREPAAWSFDLYREGARTTVQTPGPMTLAEAKRFAVQEARQIGGIVHIELAA